MSHIYAIASRFTPGKPQPPVRDPNYLKFIRSLPSAVSGRYGCDAAHCGPHGIGTKASDLSAIPLTRTEHRELHSLGPVKFAEKYGLDVPALVARLNAAYEMKQGRAA